MKNRVIALMLISALVLSSISMALSLNSRSMPEAQEHSSIPPEAFEGLGGKKGVGFGDWYLVDSTYPLSRLIIFSYPAGATSEGWDGYLVDMLITITVQLENVEEDTEVLVELKYLTGYTNMRLYSYAGAPMYAPGQSVTFTEQIYEVTLIWVEGAPAFGHYFVFADRRV